MSKLGKRLIKPARGAEGAVSIAQLLFRIEELERRIERLEADTKKEGGVHGEHTVLKTAPRQR